MRGLAARVGRVPRTAWLAAYCAAAALVHLPVLRTLYHFSLGNETASHVVLIPFVTLALLYRIRASILAVARPAPLAGAAVLLIGLGLFVAARQLDGLMSPENALITAVSALVALWLGGFLHAYGATAFRTALFPLLFLLFMIPIPAIVLDNVILLLRTGSTHAVSALFTATGTPYFREGYIFELPTTVIEIAEECSGIRSSIALLLTTLLAGHVYLDSTWKKAVLVAVTLPLTIVKNGIRIVTLSLLAMHVDPEFLTGQLHHDGGIVFYLLTLIMLAPVLMWLRPSRTVRVRTA